MSFPRPQPSIPLRKCPPRLLLRPIFSPSAICNNLNRPHNHQDTKIRPFHSTLPSKAARSPLVRRTEAARKQRSIVPGRSAYTEDWQYRNRAQGDVNERLKLLDASGKLLYKRAINFKAVDIDYRTFEWIAAELYEAAYTQVPAAHIFGKIHKDVDLVYQVGFAAAIGDPSFQAWIDTAGAMAGARVPLILSTSRYLLFSMKEKKELSKSSLFDQIERLAHHRDPRAMQLQAQILGRRGKYNEAIALMEEVLGMIWPSKVDAPTPGDEYMVSQYMLKPWEVYAWLKEKVGDPTGADEVTRVAAFEYEDPKALMKYAPIMLRAEKFDEYEECMSKAASSGNAMACLKLANFYFLTSQGFYARRGVKASGLDPMPSTVTTATVVTTTRNPTSRGPIEEKPAGKLASFFSFLFSDVKTHEEYRKLAMDWYELAYNHGSLSAAFFLAVLLREDGDHELALQFLQHVQMPEGRDAFLKQLKAQWHDKSFHLAVPIHLFDH